jgi:hypothetical protein
MKAVECVERPDHSIGIGVEESYVLLQDALVSVLACPIVLFCSVGGFDRSSFISTGSSWEIVNIATYLLETLQLVPGSFNF